MMAPMPSNKPSMPDVLKMLARTNCGECGRPTCVAFAVDVVAGRRPLEACPYVTAEDRARFQAQQEAAREAGDSAAQEAAREAERAEQAEREAQLARLRERFSAESLHEMAARLGARVVNDRLAVHCLGRVFELDRDGNLASQCHVNHWVHIPLLDYVLRGAPRPVIGSWVTLGELPAARDWARFYTHRCDLVMRQTADRDPELFLDLLELFGGKELESARAPDSPFSQDAMVLRPLPRVPLLVSHWPAEGPFESKLTTFFDASADANLGGGALFQLGSGLAEMLRRFCVRLGVC